MIRCSFLRPAVEEPDRVVVSSRINFFLFFNQLGVEINMVKSSTCVFEFAREGKIGRVLHNIIYLFINLGEFIFRSDSVGQGFLTQVRNWIALFPCSNLIFASISYAWISFMMAEPPIGE